MRFRSALLAVVLPCLVLALAPGAASAQQDNSGSCVEVGSQGTKHDYRCRMGPVTVAPFQVLTKELVFSVPKPDVDGFVTSMNVDVVDANGKRVPINRLMLHHIVFLNFGKSFGEKRDPTCGDSFEAWNTMSALPNAAERFYGAGEERAEMQRPEGHGPQAQDGLDAAEVRQARGRRRSRARRWPGAQAAPTGVSEQLDLHVTAGLGRREPPLLQGQTGPARTRPDPHDRLLLGPRGSARGGRESRARFEVRPRPGGHARG